MEKHGALLIKMVSGIICIRSVSEFWMFCFSILSRVCLLKVLTIMLHFYSSMIVLARLKCISEFLTSVGFCLRIEKKTIVQGKNIKYFELQSNSYLVH